MRFLAKIVARALISFAGFLAIWTAAFQLHVDRTPFVVTCGAAAFVLTVAARYSRLEERRRRVILALVVALPFATSALMSFPAVFDGIAAPSLFWAILAVGAATISLVVDSFFPGCSSCHKRA